MSWWHRVRCVVCVDSWFLCVTKSRKPPKSHTTNARHTQQTPGTHNKRQPTNAGQQRYMSHKRQSPNQAAVQGSSQHTNHACSSHHVKANTPHSHHTAPRHQAQTQGHGTRHRRDKDPCSAHTTNTEAPMMKPTHGSTGTLGSNKQNRRNLKRSKP